MKNIKQFLTATALCITVINYTAHAQAEYKTSGAGNSMKMSGTSTFHDWTMSAQTFTGGARFGVADKKLSSVKELTFILPVEDLKGSEKGLDKNAYEALKSGQYKDILYKLTLAQVMPSTTDKYMVKTRGDLTIAGVTKQVIMDVYCTVNADASVTCTGTDRLKMTDYNVSPPKFMLGAMTTGDEITLNFTAIYKQ